MTYDQILINTSLSAIMQLGNKISKAAEPIQQTVFQHSREERYSPNRWY